MDVYKFYKLKNKGSVIGFPFIALCQTDSSYITCTTNNIINISPDFSDQTEGDIDIYLDDYSSTELTFLFDYDSLLGDLNLLSERQISLSYHSEEPLLTVIYHEPYHEVNIYAIPESAKKKLDNLIVLFSKIENQ